MDGGTFWSGFEHDPRLPENARLRASDRDREQVSGLLGSAYAEGRLTRSELDDRTSELAVARTLSDFAPLVDDLLPHGQQPPVASRDRSPATATAPSEFRAEAEAHYRNRLRSSLFVFLLPTLITWIVWIAVSVGHGAPIFPFPAIVTVATGVPLVLTRMARTDIVAGQERRLVKRERRRQYREGLEPPAQPPELS